MKSIGGLTYVVYGVSFESIYRPIHLSMFVQFYTVSYTVGRLMDGIGTSWYDENEYFPSTLHCMQGRMRPTVAYVFQCNENRTAPYIGPGPDEYCNCLVSNTLNRWMMAQLRHTRQHTQWLERYLFFSRNERHLSMSAIIFFCSSFRLGCALVLDPRFKGTVRVRVLSVLLMKCLCFGWNHLDLPVETGERMWTD